LGSNQDLYTINSQLLKFKGLFANYKHLSLKKRHYIAIELKKETSINAIAKALHRTQGTQSPKRYNV